ncbi:MAG: phosphopyruvate hydratase [bacterium]
MNNKKIKAIKAREILDSKGSPTIEVDLFAGKEIYRASVPSGVSAGKNEATELRDGGERYGGRGVTEAVRNINELIAAKIIGQDAGKQKEIDELIIALDGTGNKSKLGANALLAVSIAVSRAGAATEKMPLYQYLAKLSGNHNFVLPQPMILVLEGGKHGSWASDLQEYMIIPKKEKFPRFADALEAGTKIFSNLQKILLEKGYAIGVGYEGAPCPKEMKSNEEGFSLIVEAVGAAGFKMPLEVSLAADGAASEFFEKGKYVLRSEGNKELSSQEWIEKIVGWVDRYYLDSLEDMLGEEDWDNWQSLTRALGQKVQIVGDDLLATNIKRILKAASLKAANAVIIKPNQIGTVSETLAAIKSAQSNGLKTIISHRAGETNDDFIADLTVGTAAGQCKFGAPNRGERIAKYNRLLRIEEELGN